MFLFRVHWQQRTRKSSAKEEPFRKSGPCMQYVNRHIFSPPILWSSKQKPPLLILPLYRSPSYLPHMYVMHFSVNICSLTLDIERYLFWCNAEDTYCYGNEDQSWSGQSTRKFMFQQIWSNVAHRLKDIWGHLSYHIIYDTITHLI